MTGSLIGVMCPWASVDYMSVELSRMNLYESLIRKVSLNLHFKIAPSAFWTCFPGPMVLTHCLITPYCDVDQSQKTTWTMTCCLTAPNHFLNQYWPTIFVAPTWEQFCRKCLKYQFVKWVCDKSTFTASLMGQWVQAIVTFQEHLDVCNTWRFSSSGDRSN